MSITFDEIFKAAVEFDITTKLLKILDQFATLNLQFPVNLLFLSFVYCISVYKKHGEFKEKKTFVDLSRFKKLLFFLVWFR